MYKETLEILMEDINDHNNIKKNILKNQLSYHFNNKNCDNKNVLDNTAVIVRRILQNFTLNEIIGFQPIIDTKNPTVVSGGKELNCAVATRALNIKYPEIQPIDLQPEINQACALEIETEVTNEFLRLISKYAPERVVDNEVADAIIDAAIEVYGSWAIISLSILSRLESSGRFLASGNEGFSISGGLMYVGTLDNEIKIYTSLYEVEDCILIGSKEANDEDTGIIYAPEVMIKTGIRTIRPADLEAATPLLTSYGAFVNQLICKDQYRKISINY